MVGKLTYTSNIQVKSDVLFYILLEDLEDKENK